MQRQPYIYVSESVHTTSHELSSQVKAVMKTKSTPTFRRNDNCNLEIQAIGTKKVKMSIKKLPAVIGIERLFEGIGLAWIQVHL